MVFHFFVDIVLKWKAGFEEVDSIYASPEDFREMREANKAKGVHLLEFFVKRCHEIGVNKHLFLQDV